MPRGGAIIFGDLVGKLDALEVACDKCGRKGRYAVARLTGRFQTTTDKLRFWPAMVCPF
jgi:hypothetical protein